MKKLQRLRITRAIYEQIKQTIGSQPAEQGGALGGSRKNFIVQKFYLDHTAGRTTTTYTPDENAVNQFLRERWRPAKTELLGFVHSHPPEAQRPSSGDLVYAQRILQVLPKLSYLLLPIVISEADSNTFQIYPYAVVRNGRGVRVVDLTLDITDSCQDTKNGRRSIRTQRLWLVTFALVVTAAMYILRKRDPKSM